MVAWFIRARSCSRDARHALVAHALLPRSAQPLIVAPPATDNAYSCRPSGSHAPLRDGFTQPSRVSGALLPCDCAPLLDQLSSPVSPRPECQLYVAPPPSFALFSPGRENTSDVVVTRGDELCHTTCMTGARGSVSVTRRGHLPLCALVTTGAILSLGDCTNEEVTQDRSKRLWLHIMRLAVEHTQLPLRQEVAQRSCRRGHEGRPSAAVHDERRC